MWSLGVFIYELFNGELREVSSLRNTSKVRMLANQCQIDVDAHTYMYLMVIKLTFSVTSSNLKCIVSTLWNKNADK